MKLGSVSQSADVPDTTANLCPLRDRAGRAASMRRTLWEIIRGCAPTVDEGRISSRRFCICAGATYAAV